MSAIERINRWFSAHCDGEWEHGGGVRIETTDNPGWLVRIDISGTAAHILTEQGQIFQEREPCELTIEALDANMELWGYCEPPRLEEMLNRMADILELYQPQPRDFS